MGNKCQYIQNANNINILSCSILTIPYEIGTVIILLLLMHELRL